MGVNPSKPINLKNAKKWVVRFEHRPYEGKGTAKKIERVLYDIEFLGIDLKELTHKTKNVYNTLLLSTIFLRNNYREYKSPAEIIPPAGKEIGNGGYITWMGFDPEIVSQWGIETQPGDNIYDILALTYRKEKGKYVLLAIASDEPGMTNTLKHIKDIIRFSMTEPRKMKYVDFIGLKLPESSLRQEQVSPDTKHQ